jgi:hypothetical protein
MAQGTSGQTGHVTPPQHSFTVASAGVASPRFHHDSSFDVFGELYVSFLDRIVDGAT